MSGFETVFVTARFAGHSNAPLYLRVKKLVQDAVADGRLKAGDAIPSERDAAEKLGISRVTVRKAFTEMVRDGTLVQRRGSGTFVRGSGVRLEQPLSRLTSFSEDMQLRGLKTAADWLDRSSGLPTPDEALKLAISPSEYVCRFHRLRRADGEALAIELAVVPQRFLETPLAVEQSLYRALEQRGYRPVRALQRLHAVALQQPEAGWLDLPAGAPALLIERLSYLSDGRVVEYTKSHYRGDSYDFVAELTLVPEVHL